MLTIARLLTLRINMLIKTMGYFQLSHGAILANVFSNDEFEPISVKDLQDCFTALFAAKTKFMSVPFTSILNLDNVPDKMKAAMVFILTKLGRISGAPTYIGYNIDPRLTLESSLKMWAAKVIDDTVISTSDIDSGRDLLITQLAPGMRALSSATHVIETAINERRNCLMEHFGNMLKMHMLASLPCTSSLYVTTIRKSGVDTRKSKGKIIPITVIPSEIKTHNSDKGLRFLVELEDMSTPYIKKINPNSIFSEKVYRHGGLDIMKVLHLPITPVVIRAFNEYGISGSFSEYIKVSAPILEGITDEMFINELHEMKKSEDAIARARREGSEFSGVLYVHESVKNLSPLASDVAMMSHTSMIEYDDKTGICTTKFDDLQARIPIARHIARPSYRDVLFNMVFDGRTFPADRLNVDEFTGAGRYIKISSAAPCMIKMGEMEITIPTYNEEKRTWTNAKYIVPLHRILGTEFPFKIQSAISNEIGFRRAPMYHIIGILGKYLTLFQSIGSSARTYVPGLRITYQSEPERRRNLIMIGACIYDELLKTIYGVGPFTAAVKVMYPGKEI